jgi:hypothetical protein
MNFMIPFLKEMKKRLQPGYGPHSEFDNNTAVFNSFPEVLIPLFCRPEPCSDKKGNN